MSSQDFFYLSLAVSLVLLLSFLLGRRGYMPPSKLDLKKSASSSRLAEDLVPSEQPAEKNLNVIFMFNGHSFDAFEVLGLPAGSSLLAVEAAFLKLKKQVDSKQAEFIHAAYQAIKRSRIE
jgi:hypothetical protein